MDGGAVRGSRYIGLLPAVTAQNPNRPDDKTRVSYPVRPVGISRNTREKRFRS